MSESLLLRVSEAAELLGLGTSKVYELIREGRLAAVKVDGSIRVPRAAIEEYVASLPRVPGAGILEDLAAKG